MPVRVGPARKEVRLRHLFSPWAPFFLIDLTTPAALPTTHSILATLAGGTTTAVSPPPAVMVVPVGANGGYSTFPYVGVFGAWTTRFIKGKKLFTDDFEKRYTAV